MRADAASARARGRRIALVPTMGALHQGHLSLFDYARPRCDYLVVSIFVNPLQFDRQDDLDSYPRTWETDLEACRQHGVHTVYAPRAQAMYPEGYQTTVQVQEMTKGLCGAFRPGHFHGVTTVVLKLFNAVTPHFAVFGEKDFQQLRVIQRMVRDLDLGVEVIGRPTVREPDGLALSSRNQHLSERERQDALCLWRALRGAQERARSGETDVKVLVAAARAEVEATPGTRLEYLEVVDDESLEPLERLDRPARMCLAVWMGSTRLIDNVALS